MYFLNKRKSTIMIILFVYLFVFISPFSEANAGHYDSGEWDVPGTVSPGVLIILGAAAVVLTIIIIRNIHNKNKGVEVDSLSTDSSQVKMQLLKESLPKYSQPINTSNSIPVNIFLALRNSNDMMFSQKSSNRFYYDKTLVLGVKFSF